MTKEQEPASPVFRIDVSPGAERRQARPTPVGQGGSVEVLLTQLVEMQSQQNQLLQQLVSNSVQNQQQRANELKQWKDANPRLARSCQRAAESLSRIQTQFLETITEEIADNEENLIDGDFMFNEFVDRYGPRLAHLNGVLQVLAQLGTGVPAQQA
jgi:exonuclease VII large subunit